VSDAAHGSISPHVWRIAAVLTIGSFVSALDTTVINVALDALSNDLHASIDQIQWVVTVYLLAFAAVIPITGWAARRFGARRVWLIALFIFTASSALCAAANSLDSLIAFRVFQGIGGGMLAPVGQIVLVSSVTRVNLPRLISATSMPVILAPVFGPTLGGILLQDIGWRSLFLINIPFGVVGLIAGAWFFPREEPDSNQRLDTAGALLLSAGLIGVSFGLANATASHSIRDPLTLVPLLLGSSLAVAYVIHARRAVQPLLDVRLYVVRSFRAAALATFLLGAALFGGMILMPLYLQIVRHEDAITTGLLLAPQGIGMIVGMAVSPRLVRRLGPSLATQIGIAIMAAATIPFLFVTATTSFETLNTTMALRGFGIGVAVTACVTAAFSKLANAQVSHGAPQINMLQRVGGSLGVASLSVILQYHLSDAHLGERAAAFASTYRWLFGVTLLAMVPMAITSAFDHARSTPEIEVEAVLATSTSLTTPTALDEA
jgi:EmrB/QacA subfamily drug resistance transporter